MFYPPKRCHLVGGSCSSRHEGKLQTGKGQCRFTERQGSATLIQCLPWTRQMIFPADLLCYGFNKAATMVPYKKHQLREELYQNCDLPKLKGNETQATEGGEAQDHRAVTRKSRQGLFFK